MPAACKPIMPRKRPMPAVIAIFRLLGILSTMYSRTGVTDRMKNRIPEMKTAPSATSQLWPMPSTTP
ncbi:hypothetical protein D3C83_110180 [compost metagenome]